MVGNGKSFTISEKGLLKLQAFFVIADSPLDCKIALKIIVFP